MRAINGQTARCLIFSASNESSQKERMKTKGIYLCLSASCTVTLQPTRATCQALIVQKRANLCHCQRARAGAIKIAWNHQDGPK